MDPVRATDHERLPTITPHRILGVVGEAPSLQNAKRDLPAERPVMLQMFPRHGRLYIAGFRSFHVAGDDIHFRILHPRTKQTMADGPGSMFNPDEDVAQRFTWHEGHLFMWTFAWHVQGEREPVYCSEQEPLLIEVTGSVPFALNVFGNDTFEV